ncbi:hypothetical protein [Streptomyces sp. LS1784]|nr:hypothetical protein [Streptomyces sp. LS1784]
MVGPAVPPGAVGDPDAAGGELVGDAGDDGLRLGSVVFEGCPVD